jgi:hypothetical protein
VGGGGITIEQLASCDLQIEGDCFVHGMGMDASQIAKF